MKLAFGLVTFGLLARLGHAANLVKFPDQHVLAGKPVNGDQPATKFTKGVRKE